MKLKISLFPQKKERDNPAEEAFFFVFPAFGVIEP